jgi:hypothetical protein
MLEFDAFEGGCCMGIKEELQELEDEPTGITARSADGRLFFIPDSEAERLAVEDSEEYRAFVARRGAAPVERVESLYPCGLVRDWLDSHKPNAKWRRISIEYGDNCF